MLMTLTLSRSPTVIGFTTLGAGVPAEGLAALFQGCGIRTHLSCLSHLITPYQQFRRHPAPKLF